MEYTLYIVAKGPGNIGPTPEREDWVTDVTHEYANGRIGQVWRVFDLGQIYVRWVVQPLSGDPGQHFRYGFVDGDWLLRQRIARMGPTGEQELSTPDRVL